MRIARCLAWGIWLAFLSTAWGKEVVVEGSAPVRGGDMGQARELATRRALARAAESHAAAINAQTNVRTGVALESVLVRAAACTQDVQVLDEKLANSELSVTVKVTVLDGGSCRSSCQRSYTNKIVVTGIAMEFPEQKLPEERSWLANLTAIELARMLGRHRRLLADHEGRAFPYKSPARAPEPRLFPQDRETLFSVLASKYRGQYVLSGIYRDFGLRGSAWGKQTRRMEIEAFLHDGANGAVLARRSFVREASGAVILADRPVIGSAEFYAGDLGRAWGALLDDIARWTEEQAACLPFMARVIKNEGKLLHIDAGAESGLSAGDTLNIHNWLEPPVRETTGLALGREKTARATASIKHVYPRFSIMELIEAPPGLEVKVGDILYAQ